MSLFGVVLFYWSWSGKEFEFVSALNGAGDKGFIFRFVLFPKLRFPSMTP